MNSHLWTLSFGALLGYWVAFVYMQYYQDLQKRECQKYHYMTTTALREAEKRIGLANEALVRAEFVSRLWAKEAGKCQKRK